MPDTEETTTHDDDPDPEEDVQSIRFEVEEGGKNLDNEEKIRSKEEKGDGAGSKTMLVGAVSSVSSANKKDASSSFTKKLEMISSNQESPASSETKILGKSVNSAVEDLENSRRTEWKDEQRKQVEVFILEPVIGRNISKEGEKKRKLIEEVAKDVESGKDDNILLPRKPEIASSFSSQEENLENILEDAEMPTVARNESFSIGDLGRRTTVEGVGAHNIRGPFANSDTDSEGTILIGSSQNDSSELVDGWDDEPNPVDAFLSPIENTSRQPQEIPATEEPTPEPTVLVDGVQIRKSGRTKQFFYFALFVLVVIVVVAVIVAISSSRSRNQSSPETTNTPTPSPTSLSPTPFPTSAPTRRLNIFVREVALQLTPLHVINDPESAQHRAIRWLTNEDMAVDSEDAFDLKLRYAAVTLYFATNGPKWKNQCNFLSHEHICQWFEEKDDGDVCGLKCSDSLNASVDWINLERNRLAGTFPPEIGVFDKLAIFMFRGNFVQGEIPSSLFKISTFVVFDVGENRLKGTFPSFYSNLNEIEVLQLDSNFFVGTIPSTIGQFNSLRFFTLIVNGFAGTIPSSMANLKNLSGLLLSDNFFTGPFPSFFADMLFLFDFRSESTMLTGTIPDQIGGFPSLSFFSVKDNMMNGPIPSTLFSERTKAVVLSDNDFTGHLPSTLSDATSMESIVVSRNQLSGKIPSRFGSLEQLDFVDFGVNFFTGSLPSFDRVSPVKILSFHTNQMNGTIPSELGLMRSLRWLYLHNNSFSGTIPESFASVPNLQEFSVLSNRPTGTVPTSFGQQHLIRGLYFADNLLEGNLNFLCSGLLGNREIFADCYGDNPRTPCSCCSHCCMEPSICYPLGSDEPVDSCETLCGVLSSLALNQRNLLLHSGS